MGDEAGHAFALDILAADGMARTLRRDHEHVDVRGRHDLAEMDVEAMGEGQGLAGGQVGLDVLLVHIGLALVVDEDHDDVGRLGGVRRPS